MSIQGNSVGGLIPTAEQVGARPNTWTPTPAEVGSLPAIEDSTYPGCYYRMVDGVQEWINPPMVLGEEYRTVERYNDLIVYIRACALDLSTSGSKYVGIHYGLTNVVSIEGSIFKRSDSSNVKLSTYDYGIGVNAYGNLIFNVTENCMAYPIVKYTK